jgi:hypothetical protein
MSDKENEVLLNTIATQNETIKMLLAENKRLKQFVMRVQVDIKELFLDKDDMMGVACQSINHSLFLLASGDDLTMQRTPKY